MPQMDETFLRYNALDSACMMDIEKAIWPDLKEEFQQTYDMTLAIFPVLMFMQTRGVAVSHALLEETKVDVLRSAREKQEELDQIVGKPLNVNSSKQCIAYFYVEKKIAPYFNKAKKPTVDDKALQRLVRGTSTRPGLREAKLVQEIRGLQKLYGTYLDIQFDADSRMRGSYNPRGCLLPETEVLTKDGWVSLENFKQGDAAMEWAVGGKLSWGNPKKVVYDVDEVLTMCDSEQHTCIYTPDHRIPSYQPNTNKFDVRTANKTALTYRQLPVSGSFSDGYAGMESFIRILVMVQADGCISEGNVILNFKNQDKINRCEHLLLLNNLEYTTPKGNDGYTRFSIRRNSCHDIIELLGKEKLWDSWLLTINDSTMDAFLDEIQYWDASKQKGVVRYNTIHKTNADWVATIAHIRNKKALVTYQKSGYCPLYRVSIQEKNRASLKERYWKDYPYKGKVYCLETSTEFFLARYKGQIFVTGNTKFGRLSSSKTIFDTGMNFQNLPAEFKKFLVPDPGYMFIELDKAQAEWVVVAYVTGDANMISAIEQGIDVHLHTATLMFNIEKELVERDKNLIGHSTDADMIMELRLSDPYLKQYAYTLPRTMSARQCGKKSNHGLNYDEGYRGFAMINEMDEKEAKRIYELYHRIYPGIKIWYEAIKRDLQRSRTLVNCLGRKVRFMGQWGDDLFKSAYSMLPQSTVVDSLNLGMEQIYEDTWITQNLNVDVLAQVHDSILMQVPIDLMKDENNFNEFHQRICYYTSPELEYGGKTFKIKSDIKIGLNWGEHHKSHNHTGMVEVNNHTDLLKAIEGWENLSGERASGLA